VGVDADGLIALVNAQAERLFGYRREELLGQPIELLVPEDAREAHPGHRQQYLTNAQPRPMGAGMPLSGRRKDGSRFPAEISLSPIDTEHGALVAAAVRDVSDRIRAEAKFRGLLEAAPDAIVGVTPDGRICLVNAQTERLFRYHRDELLGQSVEILVPEYVRDRHPDRRRGYLHDPTPRPMGAGIQLAGRRKDGSQFPAEISLSSIDTEDGVLVSAAIRDVTEQRRATEEQNRLASIVHSSHDAIMGKTLLGVITSWNPGAQRLYGYTEEEMIGRAAEVLFPADLRAAEADFLARIGRGERVEQFQTQRLRKDGSPVTVSLSMSPIADADGTIIGVASVSRDISERQRAEAKFRGLLEAAPDAIVGVTPDGIISLVNAQVERLFGYQRDQLLGQPVEILVPEYSRDRHPEHRAGYLHDPAPRPMGAGMQLAGRRRDGSQFPAEISLSSIDTEDGVLVSAAIRDVSDRIRAETKFRDLLEAASDAIVGVTPDGQIALVNAEAERVFGYRRDELVGQPVEILVPDRARGAHPTHRTGYFVHPSPRPMGAGMQLAARRKDGTEFPAEISLVPLDTDQGTLVSAAIRDVSERLQVEQTLARARDEALATAELKSQFVAMVSHEIRTPMNGVIGLTNLLLEAPLEPGPRRYAQAIRASGQALLMIINDILDFSKIEAGKIELIDVDFDLDKLLDEVIRAAAETARDKGLEVLACYPPDLPSALRGDAGRLRQVLLNLLGNAVKFTEHGEVVLRAEPGPAAPGGEPRITFTVADTGIGIAAKDLSRMFEPFAQVDGSTNREFGGTGLGLAITRQLVDLMHGQLGVQSEPGRGSQFSFTIPVTLRSTFAGRKSFPDRLSDRKLLVVDDNPISRHLITQHTRAWGMVPSEAPDGQTALDLLRDAAAYHPYAVAVIDQRMPGLDGVELTGEIHADPTIPPIQIVLLTSGSHHDDQTASAAGADAVLPKPIGPSQLHDCLLELLDSGTARAAEKAVSAEVHAATGSRGLILLAEDNAINQMVAVDTLAMLGYQADIARNGLEALQLATTRPYLAVLMDCQMPKMDGYTATTELRRRETPNQHIPVIAMTAGALAEDKQRCLAAGMDDYLAKPIKPDQLQAALDRWTSAAAAQER